MTPPESLRIGIDLGGTKTAGIVMDNASRILFSRRVATPAGNYAAIVTMVGNLVAALESGVACSGLPVGIGTPGSLSPTTGMLRNANSTCLNGQPFKRDLEVALGREIRMANDADCLAVSEATDGAAAGAASVFGVILGTGVGGAIVRDGRLVTGANAIAGEWGHIPLPWPDARTECPGTRCWCGQYGCIETWLSGPGLEADFQRRGGQGLSAKAIVQRAQQQDPVAQATLAAYEQRLARALAMVINLLDPEVIVCGGGMSQIASLYARVPALWQTFVFSDHIATRLAPATHGDASGVRGAAWLHPAP